MPGRSWPHSLTATARSLVILLNIKTYVRALASVFRFSMMRLPIKQKEELIIVVPFRNREDNLKQFVPHMNAFLKDIKHRIVVIEQTEDSLFNRAKLLNVGFCLYQHRRAYFCFHDVDLLPESALCDYVRIPVKSATQSGHFGHPLGA